MGLQKYFEEFNKNIKMDYDELAELVKKREILLKKLKKDKDLPSFSELNLGSYSMYTGVKPIGKDYDIDVGLRFNVSKDEYEPLELKEKVYDVLKNHTEYGAEIKRPCVTVNYKKNGEIAYHVDLAIYSYRDKDDTNSQLYLAWGKKNSSEEYKYWEEADPVELKDKIMNKFKDREQRNQYRRIIRYMKRWKNLKFSSSGNSEPPGIGITLLAYEKFEPKKWDLLESKYIFDDLEALICFVKNIKNLFIPIPISDSRELQYKIEYYLPVKPYTNVFSKMTVNQMTDFRNKIVKLLDDLEKVDEESDIVEQCKKLNKIFGRDFPIPSKYKESKKQKNFVPPTSTSGKEL